MSENQNYSDAAETHDQSDRRAMEEEMLAGCEDAISAVLEEHGIDPESPQAAKLTADFLNDIQVEDHGREFRNKVLGGIGLFALGGASVYGGMKVLKRFANSSNDEAIDCEMTGLIGD